MSIIKVADLGISSGVNTPAFLACLSADFSISNNVNTVMPLDEVYYNDDSVWNTSTYRFTAPSAGRYFFYSQLH